MTKKKIHINNDDNYATEITFVKGRIKFGKRDENGNFYLPLNAKGKTQAGTKDSMIVVFDGRKL